MIDPRISIISKYVNGRVLDMGFCFGHLHEQIKKITDDVWGIDISYSGNEKNHIMGDVTDMKFENAFFDVIVAGEIIEHLDSPEKMISECHRVLKSGGILILSTPNKKSLLNRILKNYEHQWHKILFDEKSIRDILYNKFDVISFSHFPFTSASTSDYGMMRKVKTVFRLFLNIFTPNNFKEDMIIVAKKRL
jgi:2-polyprenyl-3-methyl-5-hydroxy-6-metoxy-1,4-benzoquinol methylase